MAGSNQKPSLSKASIFFNNTEVLNDSSRAPAKKQFLGGVLNPGESIDFNRENTPKFEKPKFDNYLQKEQAVFVNQHQDEVRREIEELLLEIKKLAKSTDNLEQAVKMAVEQPIVEFTAYERNFLYRIKNLISQFRTNVSEASNCFEMFQSRKKKKNAFWNKAKSGGQKYMDSGEHAVARSAN
jgi:hypothetical protein